MRLRLSLVPVLVAGALAVLAGAPSAATGADARPDARPILLGLLGAPSRFQQLTGQRTTVGHVIAGWGQGPFQRIFGALGEAPMLGMKSRGLSSLDIANGKGDAWLIDLNRAVADLPGRVYVRPLAEMNGHWNDYCAFNKDGSSRGPARSTAAFRKAFARIYVIVHGGPLPLVNAALRRLGLPQLGDVELAENPMPRVRVVWNPQGYGSPDVPGNSAQAYYPADAYVDVVANDLYNIRGKAEWAANEQLYDAHPGKPYAIAEWANWGFDDPEFVHDMATFAKSHRRVELLVYYNGRPGSPWDIAKQPRSRAAYRSAIVPLAG